MLETFYATSAQICFALLGLWWVVVQFKYDLFMRQSARRRTAYNISLYFILPGAMSLIAVLAADASLFWQITFAVAGGLGIVETIRLIRTPLPDGSALFDRAAGLATLLIYVLIVVFAVAPGIVRALGIPPLYVEGVLIVFIILLGIQFAWNFFTQPTGE